ncbi:beta-N-acetylhexosaminidase [Paenibacillus sp. MMS18-CY102]|uniref:beta-N-acetylhexosaminidase n=1 Tax=Paenibacillus sp. MMS18-CY102 TaxID=2682849 RepID=UPI0013656E0E|nr:beta-N-acetylhexosaminidase [Paenibacillus sp. MMS18-CY102]MWC28845.1 family 20 glycosylhydrolase [Paenibacillus sp. MMS18-CY102]
MKIRFNGEVETLLQGIERLAPALGVTLSSEEDAIQVQVSHLARGLSASWDGAAGRIGYTEKHQFFRALSLFVQHYKQGEPFRVEEEQHFRQVGPMFDVSRNAVLTVESFKQMLDMLALMGMNTVMLYMEDTYTIDGEPYFGYMRGRYSFYELKEIDDYADQYGIEAFPSIQTLAHMEEFLKWEPVFHYKDTKGALLVGDERTNQLVERMIKAVSAPFRSKKIHIGMDEAEELGRGRYLDRNGFSERFDIMTAHLDRVLAVVRSQGLQPMMWSDMFLKIASGAEGRDYDTETTIPEEMASRIPSGVDMVYWDYVHTEREDYEKLIAAHRPIGSRLIFAGAVWIFNTFGVNYGLSLTASDTALQVCKEQGIDEVYATMWGDDGNEGNPFAALLGLQLYAEHAYTAGQPTAAQLAERVKQCTGMDAESFLLQKDLDETPGAEPNNSKQSNPSKFLLYQDVLLGLFDHQIAGLELNSHYAQLEARILSKRVPGDKLDHVLDVPEKLCAVLKLKSEQGIALKAAYDAGDREALRHAALVELPAIAEAVRALRAAHRTVWLRTFKPFGWEVIDIRYGGVLSRLDTAAYRLLEYADGRLGRIEELEQERLVYSSANRFNNRGLGWCSYYYRMASPNVFYHVVNPF